MEHKGCWSGRLLWTTRRYSEDYGNSLRPEWHFLLAAHAPSFRYNKRTLRLSIHGWKMRPLRVLNVAEKNDAAKELSRIMSRGHSSRVMRFAQVSQYPPWHTQTGGCRSYNIDLFSLYLLFSNSRPRDVTLGNSFFQMSSYARAYLCVNLWKNKRKIPPEASHGLKWENKTYKLKRSIWLVI